MKRYPLFITSLTAATSLPLFVTTGCSCFPPTPPTPPTPEPEVQDFSTDPWDTVCYYANKGLDKLCMAYNCKPNELIGKTRTITVNDQEHTVMVIGTNEDIYKVEGANYLSALTFQFKTPLKDNKGQVITTLWNNKDESKYWSSTIHSFLNNDKEDETKSVYEMIKESNSWAEQCIRPTVRQVNEQDGINWKINWGDEKIFLPCLSDLFSIAGLQATDDAVINAADVAQYYYENIRASQYSFYKNKIKDGYVAKQNDSGDIIYKQYPDLKFNQDYWIVSPYLSIGSYSWHVTNDGYVHYDAFISQTTKAIAPCFCI